ncbi:MAG: AtpZ/AtpI family protein [Dehalococcoidia bacterium]|nr:AtpZ/AtpI family protein [Dehalococcoidia bacterium]
MLDRFARATFARGHGPGKGGEAIWNSPALGLLGIGAFLATSIAGMTVVGNLLDRHFETEPVLTLVFLVLGMLAGFYGAYVQLRDFMKSSLPPDGDGNG